MQPELHSGDVTQPGRKASATVETKSERERIKTRKRNIYIYMLASKDAK